MRCLGQKCRFMASLKMVKEPLISAWLATIAAMVAMVMPTGRKARGIMA